MIFQCFSQLLLCSVSTLSGYMTTNTPLSLSLRRHQNAALRLPSCQDSWGHWKSSFKVWSREDGGFDQLLAKRR